MIFKYSNGYASGNPTCMKSSSVACKSFLKFIGFLSRLPNYAVINH